MMVGVVPFCCQASKADMHPAEMMTALKSPRRGRRNAQGVVVRQDRAQPCTAQTEPETTRERTSTLYGHRPITDCDSHTRELTAY